MPGGPYSKILFHGFRPPGSQKDRTECGNGDGNEVDKVFSPLTEWVISGTYGMIQHRSFSSFLLEAIVSGSGMDRDVHSLTCSSCPVRDDLAGEKN